MQMISHKSHLSMYLQLYCNGVVGKRELIFSRAASFAALCTLYSYSSKWLGMLLGCIPLKVMCIERTVLPLKQRRCILCGFLQALTSL